MMFDLQCDVHNHKDGVDLLSLEPKTLVQGHMQTSLFILTSDLNNQYKMMPPRNDDNWDSDSDEDDENRPIVAMKRSLADKIW